MSTSKKKSKRGETDFAYNKIHIPAMKSVYWKYFGFPADENNEIITKQKIICTLCKKILKNHYNTTNIRAHIQSNHKVIFSQLVNAHGITVPPRKSLNKKSKSEVSISEDGQTGDRVRRRSERQVKMDLNESFIEEDSMSMIPLTYEDTEDYVVKQFDDTSHAVFEAIESRTVTQMNTNNAKTKMLPPLSIAVDINPIQVDYNIEEALSKMVVKDLLNVSSIYNNGMQGFITSFLSNQILPPQSKMELAIRNLHSAKFEKLKDRIKVHSQVKAYSLSFDVWTNIENKTYVSIFYNNISEEFENQFCDNLYVTVELNTYTVLEPLFCGFNLKNCSAAVVNSNHETIVTFLSLNEIPIVHCFSFLVNTCFSEIFEIPEVASIVEEVIDVMTRYASEISSEEIEIPTISPEFSLTKVHMLKFFAENVSWPEEIELLLTRVKQFLEIVSPLEITLDTLKEEEIPLSSLFLPFANKIIEKHYSFSEYDNGLVREIKYKVVNNFKKSVCSNTYLTVSAVLDPRFHNIIGIKDVSKCLSILEKKCQQMGKQRTIPQKCETTKNDQQNNSRKSHLKMFFDDCLDDTPTKCSSIENFIEMDFRRYRDEAFASLEESPIVWWNQWGNTFGSLRHIAEAFYCILGFVNMRLKEPLQEQINNHRKRYILTGKLIDQITFLNKNT